MTVEHALDCRDVDKFIDAYVDGEFAVEERRHLEAHLVACEPCRLKVHSQEQWKRAVQAAAPREPAPPELRQRIRRALAQEPVPLASFRRWAYRSLPAAAAAGLAVTVLAYQLPWSTAPVAADAVAKHQRNLPLEVTGSADQVGQWFRGKMDFPVRPPALSTSIQCRLKGGRLSHIRDREAAELSYDVGDKNKMSVFVVDPDTLPMRGRQKERIGNREIFFDRERGYNVMMFQDEGLGYVITSDLNRSQMFKLVSGH